MEPLQVIPSTTSHKREPLLPTLDVFARLGFSDLDLNLHHIIEEHEPLDAVRAALAANRQRVLVVSGGWCDFFHGQPEVEATFESVGRQVSIVRSLGASRLRLFFGRLERERYSRDRLHVISENLQRAAAAHPDVLFVFENHDGASLDPAVCREVIQAADRPNLRLNFDPINFEKVGVPALEAVRMLAPWIGHVHLKGLQSGDYCEFGEGDVDLRPVLAALVASGYRGGFTVEYEGRFDGTVRLFRSLRRAEAAIQSIAALSGPRAGQTSER